MLLGGHTYNHFSRMTFTWKRMVFSISVHFSTVVYDEPLERRSFAWNGPATTWRGNRWVILSDRDWRSGGRPTNQRSTLSIWDHKRSSGGACTHTRADNHHDDSRNSLPLNRVSHWVRQVGFCDASSPVTRTVGENYNDIACWGM